MKSWNRQAKQLAQRPWDQLCDSKVKTTVPTCVAKFPTQDISILRDLAQRYLMGHSWEMQFKEINELSLNFYLEKTFQIFLEQKLTPTIQFRVCPAPSYGERNQKCTEETMKSILSFMWSLKFLLCGPWCVTKFGQMSLHTPQSLVITVLSAFMLSILLDHSM